MEPFVCGVKAQLGDGIASLKLSTNRPLFLVQDRLPGFSHDVIADWYAEAFGRWTRIADVTTRRIHDLAEAGPGDVVNVITVADLGGGGVLADQVLPFQGGRILRMRLNARIRWHVTDNVMPSGTVDPLRVICHEQGHFLGHQHFPQGMPLELMEPAILQNVISPQPTEAKVTAAWFGLPPSETPIPTPIPPTPPGGSFMREAAHKILDWFTAQLKDAASKTPQLWDDAAVKVFDRFDNQMLDLLLDKFLPNLHTMPPDVALAFREIAEARLAELKQ